MPDQEHRPSAWDRYRRPVLLSSAASLVLVGVVVNLGMVTMKSAAPQSTTAQPVTVEERYVSYISQGEEGTMGKPTAKNRSGLYAMKGPRDGGGVIVPKPEPMARTIEDAVSTFSIDVDTAAYSNVRWEIERGAWPGPDKVRTEELINYFTYDYPEPDDDLPMSITTELGPCPWSAEHRLVHIGVQGHAATDDAPARNLVFLIDVSGSMNNPDKLPLLQTAMAMLTSQLTDDDEVAIVVYAGAAGLVLEPTAGDDKDEIYDAIGSLRAGGSTNGGEGIQLAYRTAQDMFDEGAINRVVLATDGDFNVGTTSHDELIGLIEAKRETGVFLSVLRFGAPGHSDGTMEQLADKGNGNYAYIDRMAEAHKVLGYEAAATLETVAKDVKLQVEFDPDNVLEYRLVGYDNRRLEDHEFSDDAVDAGELGAGHSVTALYQVKLRSDDDTPGVVRMRYKEPDGDESVEHQWEIEADSGGSENLAFSAAVAEFAAILRREAPASKESFTRVRDAAAENRGEDRHCLRAEFVRIVESAAAQSNEPLAPVDMSCVPQWEGRTFDAPGSLPSSNEMSGFILGVLRLLPPLLALPLFIMGLRRPRRRRRR